MKRHWKFSYLLALLFLVMSTVASLAADKATKQECEDKVNEAVTKAGKDGLEATLKAIQNPAGPYVWKDSYLFAVTLDNARIVAHPVNPKLVDKVMLGVKDVNGKMFFTEFVSVANSQESGWVDYQWPKPGETAPSAKSSYVMKVPNENILFGAGIYTE